MYVFSVSIPIYIAGVKFYAEKPSIIVTGTGHKEVLAFPRHISLYYISSSLSLYAVPLIICLSLSLTISIFIRSASTTRVSAASPS